jgi:spore maturation protein CgeB
MLKPLRIVVIGLSISSSWGNGHATTFRGLLGGLARRGHDVLFLERDVPWYAAHRDLRDWTSVRVAFYASTDDLVRDHRDVLQTADVVIIGSYVPEGAEVVDLVRRSIGGVLMFYDIDTPITLARLEAGDDCEYLRRDQLREFDSVLSFAGGPILERLVDLGARRAHPLCCSVDPAVHQPVAAPVQWDLGYLGTYAADRQPPLDRLMLDVARRRTDLRFAVAGPMYPPELTWPDNVERIEHLPPAAHSGFYCAQRFTLNLTRTDMRRLGHSPSVRLFEAAACGAAIISDTWDGLEDIFEPYVEILPATTPAEVEQYLAIGEPERQAIGRRARERVLAAHSSDQRALELEAYVAEAMGLHALARARVGGRPE